MGALLLDILAAPGAHIAQGFALTMPPPRVLAPRQLRIAVCSQHEFAPTDVEITSGIEKAAKALSRAGMSVDYDARPDFDFGASLGVYSTLLTAEMAGLNSKISHGDYLRNEN